MGDLVLLPCTHTHTYIAMCSLKRKSKVKNAKKIYRPSADSKFWNSASERDILVDCCPVDRDQFKSFFKLTFF